MSPEQMRPARRVDARTDLWVARPEGKRPFRAGTFSEMYVMAAADPHDPMTRERGEADVFNNRTGKGCR